MKSSDTPISPRVSILLALLLLVLGLLAGKYALYYLTDSEPGYWVGFGICAGLAITFLAASGFFLNSRRDALRLQRASAGLCVACGYNLTGNTSGICPECGEKILGVNALKFEPNLTPPIFTFTASIARTLNIFFQRFKE